MRPNGIALGMPTDVDVNRLIDEFGVPEVGVSISYAAIEGVLRLTREQTRWQTVVRAWRDKLERDHNIITDAVPGVAIRVLDGRGRVGLVSRGFKSGLRKIVRSGDRATRTSDEGLSHEERRTRDYVAKQAGTFKVQAALEARKLKALPPIVEVKKAS